MPLRIGFFGQTGPYAPVAFRRLVEGGIEPVLVVEGIRGTSARHTYRYDKPSPVRRDAPPGEDLGELSRALGFATLVTSDVNAPSSVRLIGEHALDLIVCVGFDRLFSRDLLGTARLGGINAHPSKLPEWRGASPLFWALRAGRREAFVTLHALEVGEDNGAIYAQESFALPRRAPGDQIYNLAAEVAARLLLPALERASLGTLVGRPQDHARATRAPRAKAEDAFIDPMRWTGEHLLDFACGAPFFRAPWLRFGDDVFYVRRGIDFVPGRTLPASYVLRGNVLIVACKDGLVHLEIQT